MGFLVLLEKDGEVNRLRGDLETEAGKCEGLKFENAALQKKICVLQIYDQHSLRRASQYDSAAIEQLLQQSSPSSRRRSPKLKNCNNGTATANTENG